MSCPNCGYCDKCGRSNTSPAPQPFPTTYWCRLCGRTHGMYEVCPTPWITYTTTTVPST